MTNTRDPEKGMLPRTQVGTFQGMTLRELLHVHEEFDAELDRRERRMLATFRSAAHAALLDSSEA